MKKINLIILLLLPYFIYSQPDINNKFSKLKEELEYIAENKIEVKNIAFSCEGDWVLFYGEIGYSYNFLPEKAKERLTELNKNEDIITDFEMNKDAWVTISNNNAYSVFKIDKGLVSTLKKLNKNGKKIKDVDFSKNGGWVILFGKSGFASNKIPDIATQKLQKLNKKKKETYKIELYKNNGYVILFENNGLTFENIPSDTENKIKELQKQKSKINIIKFYKDKWIIIYDDYKYYCNF